MTKQEVIKEFKTLYPREFFLREQPSFYFGRPPKIYLDSTMRKEAWNNYTDYLCKEGKITLKQYETWIYPWKD